MKIIPLSLHISGWFAFCPKEPFRPRDSASPQTYLCVIFVRACETRLGYDVCKLSSKQRVSGLPGGECLREGQGANGAANQREKGTPGSLSDEREEELEDDNQCENCASCKELFSSMVLAHTDVT